MQNLPMQEREERANSKIENQEIIFFSQSSAIFFTKLLRPCSRCWRQHRDLLWLRHQGPGSFHRAAKASKLIWILKFEADWRLKKARTVWDLPRFSSCIHSFSSCGPTMSDNRREERRLSQQLHPKIDPWSPWTQRSQVAHLPQPPKEHG